MTQEVILEQIKSRLALSDIVGKVVSLKKRGKEFIGCCPFHHEKTPSFTVNDAKSFYHCFGCGVHGSVFDFLMHQEHLNFPEALERAAELAQVTLPKHTKNTAAITLEKQLLALVQEATQFFKKQLTLTEGAAAVTYLKDRRKLTETVLETFQIGYAPSSSATLKSHLLKKGFAEDLIHKAGLLSISDSGRTFDRFRNRVIFPIHNRTGSPVGFGGRALKDTDQPKYLNSPETPLFNKGTLLFNFHRALTVSDNAPLIVVEGYMDTVALSQAGYKKVVAPMGTALSPEQIQLAWKISAEPILCFDGDSAGQRAALRAVERIIPLLKPGYSFRFISLPPLEDPDSFIHKKGAEAFSKLLEQAHPLSDWIWQNIAENQPAQTPEQKALIHKNIDDLLDTIQDPKVQSFYKNDFKNRLFFWNRKTKKSPPSVGSSKISRPKNALHRQEKLLLLSCFDFPQILPDIHELLAQLSFSQPEHTQLQDFLLSYFHEQRPLEKPTVIAYLKTTGINAAPVVLTASDQSYDFCDTTEVSDILAAWIQIFELYQMRTTERQELSYAKHHFSETLSADAWTQFKKIKERFFQLHEEKDELI